jgi:hypothetical protein
MAEIFSLFTNIPTIWRQDTDSIVKYTTNKQISQTTVIWDMVSHGTGEQYSCSAPQETHFSKRKSIPQSNAANVNLYSRVGERRMGLNLEQWLEWKNFFFSIDSWRLFSTFLHVNRIRNRIIHNYKGARDIVLLVRWNWNCLFCVEQRRTYELLQSHLPENAPLFLTTIHSEEDRELPLWCYTYFVIFTQSVLVDWLQLVLSTLEVQISKYRHGERLSWQISVAFLFPMGQYQNSPFNRAMTHPSTSFPSNYSL